MKTNKIEHTIEQGLFMSRWLMAPMYLGLALSLVLLLGTFAQELIHLFSSLTTLSQHDVILGVLSLIDLSLAGNLLLIVIYSGYETFVSKMNTGGQADQPDWKGSVDFSTLKLKLIASIVAISGIHLLKVFMDIDTVPQEQAVMMVVIHMTFVIAGVLLALMDRISAGTKAMKGK